MSDIPIAEAFPRLKDRFTAVIRDFLPGRLTTAENQFPGYEFPDPEQILTSRARPHRIFSKLNVNRAAVWITRESPAQSVQNTSGDGDQRSKVQDVSIRVTAIVRDPNVPDLPTHPEQPRPMIKEEYLARRAEYYKGAIIDTVTEHAPGAAGAGAVTVDSDSAEYAEIESLGAASNAAVVFGISQDTLVRTP